MWRMTWFSSKDPVAAEHVARLCADPARGAGVVVELRGHLFLLEQPEDAARHVVDFLAEPG
jgi:pimeloyl-ACP methyl ester carboxylesterase